ncbi:MAG: class I SAM-dependent methyltransferase [Candidatus Omnitrophica bacterium]|nr:class I SAM-dependent methyltransferase [Candidatus Omnitrophota bacterium]
MEEIKNKVRAWWDSSPCCGSHANSDWGSKEFFEQVDLYKDTYEPFTNAIARYPNWRGKQVLEIGVGLGKDFSRFAGNGAKATGIDLSGKSLELTQKRLKLFNLKGNLCVADAEELPFKDNVFDLVFSWGVLHHTPATGKAIREIYRCLKPDYGKAIVMLYNKHSFLCAYYRQQYLCSRSWFKKLSKLFFPLRKFVPSENKGFSYEKMNNEELLAASTDGFGNPFSRVYTRREAVKMFFQFKKVKTEAFEHRNSMFARLLQKRKILERYFGWFLVIEAEK